MAQNENQEPKSKVFMFDEMIEAMDKSLANIEKVSNDQQLLSQVLEESEHVERFADFIEANKKQLENLQKQHDELKVRKTKLEQVMFIAKHDAKVEHVLELLIDALGLFKQ